VLFVEQQQRQEDLQVEHLQALWLQEELQLAQGYPNIKE